MFVSNQFLYKAGEYFPAWNCSPPWKFDTESVGSICVSCYPKFFSTRHIATECEWKPMWQTNWYHFLEEQGAKFPPREGGLVVLLRWKLNWFIWKTVRSTWAQLRSVIWCEPEGEGVRCVWHKADIWWWWLFWWRWRDSGGACGRCPIPAFWLN